MSEGSYSIGSSWLVARTELARAARVLELHEGGKFEQAEAGEVLDAAIRHDATLMFASCGATVVVPGVVTADRLVQLSSLLDAEVFAFEAHDDAGCAIMLARHGKLVRDRYACLASGELRNYGSPLADEPEELTAERVVEFAEVVTVEATVRLCDAVLHRRR